MATMLSITMPAVNQSAVSIATPYGAIVVPEQRIPEKNVAVDADEFRRLLLSARQAARNAYAPYSRFPVGAAAIMADDPERVILSGANIENSSYGATVCAERNTLFHGAALRFRRLELLAVSTAVALDRPLAERSPCGVCRQVIKEFTAHDVTTDKALILIDNGDPATLCEVFDIERLLPYGFSLSTSP